VLDENGKLKSAISAPEWEELGWIIELIPSSKRKNESGFL
jgi:hypothetical protein